MLSIDIIAITRSVIRRLWLTKFSLITLQLRVNSSKTGKFNFYTNICKDVLYITYDTDVLHFTTQ